MMGISGKFRKTATHTVAGGDGAPNRAGSMSWARRIAALPCGRWGKWVVLGFWVVVFAVAGPLAGKLNSAQQNDSSAWLPNNAESTQVVELAKQFSPSDVFPALVVYERPDGPITPADQAKAAADVQRFARSRPRTAGPCR
jgi:RND superfamily putative drug exporter